MSECYLRNRLNRFLSKKSALIITLVLIVFFVGSQEAFADITYGTGNYSGYYGNSGVITIAAGAVITLTGSVIFAAGSSFIMDSGSSIVCGSNYPLTITSGGASTLRTITLGAGGGIFLGRASAAPTYTTNNTITCGGALTVNAGGFPLNLNNDLNCGGISINSGSSVTVTGSPTITVNGNWTNMGGTFNAGSSTVIFNSTITGRTIRTNNSAFSTLTINGSGGYWTLNTNNLTAATLNVTAGTLDTAALNLTITGTATLNGGNLTGGAGTMNFGGGGAGGLTISNTSSTFTASATVNINDTAGYVRSAGIANWTTNSSTLNLMAWTYGNLPADTYYNFILTGELFTFSLVGTTNVNGYLTINTLLQTTLAVGANTLTVGGTITINSSCILSATSGIINVGGNWTNSGTFTCGTGTVTFNGTGAQAINGTAVSQTFNNLTIAKTAGTTLSVSGSTTTLTVNDLTETTGNFTAPATLNIEGTVTLTAGTFTSGANTNVTGDWTNNGGTFTPGSSTVTFNGTGAQAINGTVASQTFNNLTIAKTAGTTLSVSGSTTTLTVNDLTETTGNFTAPATLNIAGTVTLTDGTFDQATSTLNIGGGLTIGVSGTFTKADNDEALTFDGAGTITDNAGSQDLGNVTVTDNVQLGTNIKFEGLTIDAGYLTSNGYAIDIGEDGFTVTNGGGIDWTGSTVNVAGVWNMAGPDEIIGASTVIFDAGATGNMITSNSIQFQNVEFDNASGGWTLQDTMVVWNNFTVTNSDTSGNGVDINGQTLTVGNDFDVNGGEVTFGAAAVTIGHDAFFDNGIINGNTATIALDASKDGTSDWAHGVSGWNCNTSAVKIQGDGTLSDGKISADFYYLELAWPGKTVTLGGSDTYTDADRIIAQGGTINAGATNKELIVMAVDGAPYFETSGTGTDTINCDLHFNIGGVAETITIPLATYGDMELQDYGSATGKKFTFADGVVITNLGLGSNTGFMDSKSYPAHANFEVEFPASGTVTITDEFRIQSTDIGSSTITVNGADGATLNVGTFTLNYSAGTVDMTDDTQAINISANWTNSSGTFTAGDSTVTFNGTASGQTVTTGTSNFATVQITNSHVNGVSFADGFTCTNFTDTQSDSKITFDDASEVIVTNALTLTGGANPNQIIIVSDNPGTKAQLTLQAGGTQNISQVDVTDNDALNGLELVAKGGDSSITNTSNWALAGTTINWQGDVSDSWDTAENWDLGYVPNSSDSVILPTGVLSNEPTLASSVIIANLTIQNARTLTLAGNNLTVSSIFSNDNGTLKLNGDETVNLINDSTHGTIEYAGIVGPYDLKNWTYNNLKINGGAAVTFRLYATAITTVNGTLNIDSGILNTQDVGTVDRNLSVTGDVTIAGTLIANSSTINAAGSWTNSGTFTCGSSIVTFDGTGDQAINGTATSQTFNNLIIAKTAGTTLSVSGSTTTLTVNNLTETTGNFTCTAVLATLNINGSMTLTAGTFNPNFNTNIYLSGDWTNNGGAVSYYSGPTVIFNGSGAQAINGSAATQTFGFITVAKTAGTTLTVSGSTTTLNCNNTPAGGRVTLTSGIFDAGTNTTINVGGNWTNNGGTFTPNTGTVNFDGTCEINGTAVSQTFYNLTVTLNIGGKRLTVSGSTTILNINETLTLTYGIGPFSAGTATTINVAGNWTNNSLTGGSFAPGSGTVVFNGTGAQAINGTVASQTFNNLTIAKTAGTTLSVSGSTTTLTVNDLTETTGNFTAPATLNINGNVTLSAGTFTAGANTNVTGNWTNNGGTFTPGSGTVTFDGTGSYTITSGTESFYNVVFNDATSAATWDIGDNMDVTHDLTFTDGQWFWTYSDAAYNLTVGNDLTVTGGSDGFYLTKGTTLNVGNDLIVNGGTFDDGAIGPGVVATINVSGDVKILSGSLIARKSDINVAGDWTNNDTFTSNDPNHVIFNGTGAQAINGTVASQTFNNLTTASTSALTVGGSTTTLTLNGTLTLGLGTSFTAGTAATINVAGNWTNNGGTFTSGSGMVTFDGLTSTTFKAGGSNYNNIQINKTNGIDANDNVTFQTDAVTINGTLTITDGELIQEIALTTGAVTLVDPSSVWRNETDNANVTLSGAVANTGTISFDAPTDDLIQIRSSASPTQRNWQGAGTFNMTDVNAQDQICTGGTPANIAVTSGTDSGNNINWLFGDGDTVSGVVYQNNRTTNVGAGVTVGMYIYYTGGSTVTDTTTTGAGGAFSFTSLNLSAGDLVTLYIDDDGTYEGTTVIESNGGDALTVNLSDTYVNLVSQNDNITNTELGNADSGDADIHYLISLGEFIVDSGYNLYTTTGGTFTPGGNVTIDTANCQIVGILTLGGAYTLAINASGTLDIDGTLNLDDNGSAIDLVGALDLDGILDATGFSPNINVGGGWDNAGTFTAGNSTVTLDGVSAQTITSTIFYDLVIANTHATAEVTITSGTVTASNTLAVNDGIFNIDTGKTLDININSLTAFIIASGATLEVDGGTVTVNAGFQATTTVNSGAILNIVSGSFTSSRILLYGKLQMAAGTLTAGHTAGTLASLIIGASGGADTGDITGGTIYILTNIATAPLDIADGGKFLPAITSNDTGNLVILGKITAGISTIRNTSTAPNFSNVIFNRLQIGDAGYVGTFAFYLDNTAPLNVYNKLTIFTGATFDHSSNSDPIYVDKFDCDGTYTKTATANMFFMINGDGIAANGSISGDTDPAFGNLDIGNGSAVTSTLARAITADSLDIAANGVLDTGADQTLTANGAVTNAGTLTLNNSTMSVSGNFTNSNTINAGSSTLIFNGAALQTVTSISETYNIITVTNASGAGVVFADDFTAATLNDITPNSKLTFNDGDTYTITGAAGLNLDGQALGTEVIILSDNPGTQFTFDVTGGAQTVSRVNVTDSAASSNDITATNSINGGGNDNGTGTPEWVFGAVTRYWVSAADQDWDDNNNWALTSGGAGGVNFPGAIDTAIFDGNGAGNCILDANVSVNVVELQGAADPNGAYAGRLDANGLDITVNSTLDITGGELELDAGSNLEINGVLTINGGTLDGLNGIINVDDNIILSSGTLIAPSGNFSLDSDFTITGGTFVHSSGTLIFVGTTILTSNTETLNNVQIGFGAIGGSLTLADQADINGTFTVQNGAATTLNLGGQTLLFSGSTFNLTNLDTFTETGSTVTFDGAALQTVTSISETYNIITVTNASGAGVVFADDFTTATLNDITPNSKLTFNDGDTYTITGAAGLNLDGQALGTEVIILSDNPGTQFTFDLTGGAQTVNRVNVTDSAASSNNITANNSVNNGGNDDGDPVPHWIFSNVTITVPSAGTTVGQTPTVIGTAPPGNIVILKGTVGAVPLQQVASATADALGNYIIMQSNYTANLDIAAPNSIRAEVGVIQSSLLNINVVATPTSNQVPTIISPAEGSSVNGNKPTITGKGVAGQTVTLTVKDAAGNLLLTDVATTIVDGLGNWTISSPDYTTNLVKGINYLSATVSGTVSDIRTISLTDPFGIVFDSTTDNPIGGATVTIYNNATGLPCTPGVEIALADANPQTTGAGGAYSFLCANGNYYIIVSALGYSYPSTKTSFPAGRVIVNGSKGEVFTVASVIIQMDHPLDSGNQLLRIKKDVNKKEVVIGEVVTYTITIKNETASDVTNVYLEDMIPAGFKYINDRAILDNRQISNPTGNRPITFNIGTVSSGQTRILKYQLVVGSGVTTGNYKNSAVCKYSDGTIISNKDSETVKVTLDPLFDLGTIIGKVFWDRNEDRSQNTDDRRQKTEIGIRGVQIVMEDGTIVTTDADGKYHVPAILPGRHVLRINERTLPEGAYLTTDKVVIVDITPGILAKVNFGVNIKGRRHLPASQQAGRTEDREENGKSPAIASPDSVYRGVAISNNQVEAKSELASDRIYAKDKQANTQTGQPADPQTYTRDEQEENRLFFVVMGDAKAGYNFNKGDMEPVEDNDKFNEGFWSEGKFAYYLKGKIKGKYLITSSLDTQREQKELFRNLDPDKYYPVYGDASTINYDATNTQGRLYLLIEWDKSKVLWGNYVTGLTDTEFAQFNRTLYGGKIHFESVSSTKFAEPVTKLIVFDARAKQRAAHNEFVGTGGSLFYLKHSNIIEGSEKIKIEIRDKITGIVLTTKQMQSGFDYEIDYSNGRVIFGQSVSSIAESSSIISSQLLDGNSVCVVVDYEYEAKDNYDKGTQGVRLQQSLTDYLTVGGTYVKEEQQDKDYELKGLDVTIHLGKNIAVTAEQAESKSGQAGSFISTDGGLSFTELTNLDSDKGKAYGIKSEAYLFDKLGLTNYYKKIEGGFSSTSTISQQGKELFGAGLTWDINPKTKLALSHDEQKLIDDGNPQTQLQVGAEETKTTSAQITHQMEKLRLTGEYRHQAVTDKNDEFESETNRDEDTVAAKADYKLTEKVGISLEQQTTLRGETNNQTSVGISAQPNERLFFKAKQTVGTEGSATSVGTTVNINDKISAHTTLAVADSMEKGQTQSVVVGSQQKVNEGLVITTDKTYAKNRDTLIEGNTLGLTKEKDNRKLKGAFTQQQSQNNTETANTNIFGLSGDINDKLAMMGSFERGVVQNHDGTQATRSAGALGMSYADKNPETDNIRLQASSKLELRTDDGEEDKKQYFIYNALKWQSTINTTLFAKINISQTENTSNDSTEAQYKELVTGVAYRPIYFDRLNLLARYTYLEDSLPSDQTDFSNIEEERAHTLSGELAYDLTDKLQLVEKLAYKFGEEKVEGFDFTKTQTWLNIHRLNYNINNNWQFGAEYRFLTQKEAEDSKQGALVEVNRKIGEFVQIGAGYNFTEFNDDLTYLDYTSQGPFVRLTAMLYDRTPEEVERARQRVQEEKINQWIWELVNEELAKPNSPIMLKLNYYYNTAKKLQAEGKTKDAKELYEKIQMTSDMMYNEAEKYIRRRLELEKRIKEDNQIALVYYKQGKFKEAKELWEKITKEAKPEPIFIKF